MSLKLKTTGAAAIALLLTPLFTSLTHADAHVFTFETYSTGSPDGQDGWERDGAYDHEFVTNPTSYLSFATKSLRISNAFTTGAFDQTYAKPLVDAVGEADATAGTYSEGTRQLHFEMQFDIASTMLTEQSGLNFVVSPDRGDGSRMSFLRFEDSPGGIDVTFIDYQGTGGGPGFVSTVVASDLARMPATPHTVKLTMDVMDGPSNDVVNVYINSVIPTYTGTSWENYYRYDPSQSFEASPRIVKTLDFHTRGTACASCLGAGFVVDNMTISSTVPVPVELSKFVID